MGVIKLDETGWINGRGYRKNRLVDEVMLSCPGTLVQLVEMAPGAVIPDHVHRTSVEVYVVMEGTCRLVVNEQAYPLATGDMFLTRPGDVHRLYNEGDGPFRLLVFKTNAARQDTSWLEEITDEQ